MQNKINASKDLIGQVNDIDTLDALQGSAIEAENFRLYKRNNLITRKGHSEAFYEGTCIWGIFQFNFFGVLTTIVIDDDDIVSVIPPSSEDPSSPESEIEKAKLTETFPNNGSSWTYLTPGGYSWVENDYYHNIDWGVSEYGTSWKTAINIPAYGTGSATYAIKDGTFLASFDENTGPSGMYIYPALEPIYTYQAVRMHPWGVATCSFDATVSSGFAVRVYVTYLYIFAGMSCEYQIEATITTSGHYDLILAPWFTANSSYTEGNVTYERTCIVTGAADNIINAFFITSLAWISRVKQDEIVLNYENSTVQPSGSVQISNTVWKFNEAYMDED